MRLIALACLLGLTATAFACSDNADPGRDELTPSGTGGEGNGNGNGNGNASSGGTSSGSSGNTGTAPTFTLMATDLTGELYEDKTATIMVVPQNGFTGPVTLTLEGLGTDIIGKLDKTTLNASESTTLTAKSTKGGAVPFVVKGTAGSVVVQKTVTFTAEKVLTLRLKMGANATPAAPDIWGPADGKFMVTNALPLTVKFQNLDSVAHTLHTGGTNFAHGKTSVPQNGFDAEPRMVAAAGTRDGYMHDKGGAHFTLDVK